MRAPVALTLSVLLAGCATAHVTLLDGESGEKAGAVAVVNPKTGADVGVLDVANTRAAIGGRKVRAHRAKPARYARLAGGIPLPAAHFILYFVEGATDLQPDSEPALRQMLDEVARRPGVEVEIIGHTDTVGTPEGNDALSVARAVQVRDALVARGLDPAVTRAVGRGERELLIPTADGVREDRNRRVEIIVR